MRVKNKYKYPAKYYELNGMQEEIQSGKVDLRASGIYLIQVKCEGVVFVIIEKMVDIKKDSGQKRDDRTERGSRP